MTISRILTREAFENAIRVNAVIGGSTNTLLHLIAVARRLGVALDDCERLRRGVPAIADLMPSDRFPMQDFHNAGGQPAVMRALGEHGLLHRDVPTGVGHTIWQQVHDAEVVNREVIRDWDASLLAKGIRGMARTSHARMSGAAYGTVILHVASGAADGGPLLFVCNGDMIAVDIPARRLHLDVSDAELAQRAVGFVPRPPPVNSGYQRQYRDHVEKADLGCDFDFSHVSRGLDRSVHKPLKDAA